MRYRSSSETALDQAPNHNQIREKPIVPNSTHQDLIIGMSYQKAKVASEIYQNIPLKKFVKKSFNNIESGL